MNSCKSEYTTRFTDGLASKLRFYDDGNRLTFKNMMTARFSGLKETFRKNSGQYDEFLKDFVNLVWKLEKLCHSVAEYPVESTFRPNYDVYRIVGLDILREIIGEDKAIRKVISTGIEKKIIFPRFGHLMLADLARSREDWEAFYNHAKKAHSAFAQCGASYRMMHEAWEKCRQNGIKTEEFPSDALLKDKFCAYPFKFLTIRNDGKKINLSPCYSSLWMAYAKTISPEKTVAGAADFWNCEEFRELRRSILDGDYSYCSKLRCPRILNLPRKEDIKDPELRKIIDGNETEIELQPESVVLAYDETCNLACPSCRSGHLKISPDLIENFDAVADSFIIPLVEKGVKLITCNCSGEALASPHTLRFLNKLDFGKCPDLKIDLMSNGELLPSRWDKMGEAANCVRSLIISFDAITEETYMANRGGDFKKFMAGLEFAARLKEDGIIDSLIAVCTLYENNMPEILDIYRFCDLNGFDTLVLNKFQNWGTFTNEEFERMDIWHARHPKHHEWLRIHGDLNEVARKGKTRLYSTNLLEGEM